MTAPVGKEQTIDISQLVQLPIPQLNNIGQQLEQEVEYIGNSLATLKQLQSTVLFIIPLEVVG